MFTKSADPPSAVGGLGFQRFRVWRWELQVTILKVWSLGFRALGLRVWGSRGAGVRARGLKDDVEVGSLRGASTDLCKTLNPKPRHKSRRQYKPEA